MHEHPLALDVALLALPPLVRLIRPDRLLELAALAHLERLVFAYGGGLAASAPVLGDEARLLLALVPDGVDVRARGRPVGALGRDLEAAHDEAFALERGGEDRLGGGGGAAGGRRENEEGLGVEEVRRGREGRERELVELAQDVALRKQQEGGVSMRTVPVELASRDMPRRQEE